MIKTISKSDKVCTYIFSFGRVFVIWLANELNHEFKSVHHHFHLPLLFFHITLSMLNFLPHILINLLYRSLEVCEKDVLISRRK